MTARVRSLGLRDGRLDMSEEKLEEAVRGICNDLGVIRVHHRDSRRTTSGWPDDVLIGPGGLLFRELKRTGGKTTPAQDALHAALAEAGADVAVWRPVDLVTGRIAREVTAISRFAVAAARAESRLRTGGATS